VRVDSALNLDIVFSNPTGEEGHGFGNLVEHVSQFQKKNPGGYFKGRKLFTHHGQLLSEWTMHKKDGTELATGHTYARFNEPLFFAEGEHGRASRHLEEDSGHSVASARSLGWRLSSRDR
jgi:hypothetical protein